MGPGQAMSGRVQKKVACVQLDTLESEIQAGGLQYVKESLPQVYGCLAPSPLPLAFQW